MGGVIASGALILNLAIVTTPLLWGHSAMSAEVLVAMMLASGRWKPGEFPQLSITHPQGQLC